MINDCGKDHFPDYNKCCCFKFLVIMSEHAENQLMTQKYSYLLLNTLNHNLKPNTIKFNTMKLELIQVFLEIIGKYSSQFYFKSILFFKI
jgi:hypothetical protein